MFYVNNIRKLHQRMHDKAVESLYMVFITLDHKERDCIPHPI